MIISSSLVLSDDFSSVYCGDDFSDGDDCNLIVGNVGFVSSVVWMVSCMLLILLSYNLCNADKPGVASHPVVFDPTSTTVADEEAPPTNHSKSQTKITETYSAGVKKIEKVVTDENGHQTTTYTEEVVPLGDETPQEPQAIALIEKKE